MKKSEKKTSVARAQCITHCNSLSASGNERKWEINWNRSAGSNANDTAFREASMNRICDSDNQTTKRTYRRSRREYFRNTRVDDAESRMKVVSVSSEIKLEERKFIFFKMSKMKCGAPSDSINGAGSIKSSCREKLTMKESILPLLSKCASS